MSRQVGGGRALSSKPGRHRGAIVDRRWSSLVVSRWGFHKWGYPIWLVVWKILFSTIVGMMIQSNFHVFQSWNHQPAIKRWFTSWNILFWLVVSNIWLIFHFIYGMSSFPLTFTPSFFKMGIAPPTSFNGYLNIYIYQTYYTWTFEIQMIWENCYWRTEVPKISGSLKIQVYKYKFIYQQIII